MVEREGGEVEKEEKEEEGVVMRWSDGRRAGVWVWLWVWL